MSDELVRYSQTDFRGGINYEIEAALPNQVEDARNVWAPKGALQGRPGAIGVTNLGHSPDASVMPASFYYDASAAAFVNWGGASTDMRALATSDVLYFGYNSGTVVGGRFVSAGAPNVVTSTGKARPKWEYYNGTEWRPLIVRTYITTSPSNRRIVAFGTQYLFEYPPNEYPAGFTANQAHFIFSGAAPADWASTTVNAVNKFWVRATIVEGLVTAATQLKWNFPEITGPGASLNYATGAGTVTWADGERTNWMVARAQNDGQNRIELTLRKNFNRYGNDGWAYTTNPGTTFPRSYASYKTSRMRTSAACIPEYGVTYVGTGSFNMKFEQTLNYTDASFNSTLFDSYFAAEIESDSSIVGVLPGGQKAVYHPDYISQDSGWPQANLLLWQNSTLFTVGDPYQRNLIQWTAPTSGDVIGFRVWPEVSRDQLVNASDTSRITALSAHDEHALVFQHNSVSRMVFIGASPEGLSDYSATTVQHGIGTVSPGSVVRLPVGTAFLYDDGVYIFDGANFTKVSRQIDNYIQQINPGSKGNATAVHWAEKRCYLLSCSIGATDTPNIVFVWDYQNNAWWVWDNLNVLGWFRNIDEIDSEQIYFVDRFYSVYQLKDNVTTDHGAAITHSVRTHRFAYKEEESKGWAEIRCTSNNQLSSMTANLVVQDRVPVVRNMSFIDRTENKLGTMKLGTYADDPICSVKFRERHVDFPGEYGLYAQAYIQHSNKYEPFLLTKITVGANPEGIA